MADSKSTVVFLEFWKLGTAEAASAWACYQAYKQDYNANCTAMYYTDFGNYLTDCRDYYDYEDSHAYGG